MMMTNNNQNQTTSMSGSRKQYLTQTSNHN